MKKIISILMVLTMVMSLVACGKEEVTTLAETTEAISTTVAPTEVETTVVEITEAPVAEFENLYPDFILDETETSVTYLDQYGDSKTISKNPEKTVVLYNSLLGLWYYMGGESLAKVKGSTNVPEEGKDLVDLGSSSSVSLEAVIALEPSLVIVSGNVSGTVEMTPMLNEMGIETMIIDAKYKSYDRFQENAYLFAKVLGTEDLYHEKTETIIRDVQSIIDTAMTAGLTPRVAPMFATSKSLSLETNLAQVGEMVALLGGETIYNEDDILAEGETRIPFSIEALVAQNPEIILISTMGSADKAQATVNQMIEENPVWQEVDAVKNDRVYYLDKDLSVYKPNQRYSEAFMMIAQRMYPDLF